MIFIEILTLVLVVPLFIYHIINAHQKKLLTEWLDELSDKYAMKVQDITWLYLGLLAIDIQRGVIVLLDNRNGNKQGHIIGIDEIIYCELLIHETNKDVHNHNVDRMELLLTLKTGNKNIRFTLYENSLLASLNKKKIQLRVLDFYDRLSGIVQVEEKSASRIA